MFGSGSLSQHDGRRQESGPIIAALHRLLASTPIPTTPAGYRGSDAALGLTLLDMSLRLVHVSRLSEHLRLLDRGHVARSVSVDVDTSNLTRRQRQILTADSPGALREGAVWVPVSRYGRSDLAPVVVRDSNDGVVPRMTHRETKQAMVAGVLRLLDMLIESHVASASPSPVHDLQSNPRSRWLIEAGVMHLVDAGLESVSPDGYSPDDRVVGNTDRTDPGIRKLAHEALDSLLEQSREPFEQLLDRACREYILVVLLSTQEARVFLRWDAPLLPAKRPDKAGWLRRFLRATLPVNREFAVEYATSLPRAVKSYHLTVEVSEEIHVRRFLLSCNVDEPFVSALDIDLDAISSGLPTFDLGSATESPSTEAKLAELELQSIASRLAELGRRRRADLEAYERYIKLAAARFGVSVPPEPVHKLSALDALERLRKGDCSVAVLSSFADAYADGQCPRLASTLIPDELQKVVDELRPAQIGRDITTDNDPREHGAHAHWRQPTRDLTPRSSEPVHAVAYLALADEAPALIESITRMVVGLVIVVIGIGCFLQDGFSWLLPWNWDNENALLGTPKQADAVVAVLLLVPGLMLARLDLPSTNTVLGQLRRSQRAMATLSVCVTTVLAMVVGTVDSTEGLTISFWVAAVVLVILAGLCGVEFAFRSRRRRGRVPRSEMIPAWLGQHYKVGSRRQLTRISAQLVGRKGDGRRALTRPGRSEPDLVDLWGNRLAAWSSP